MIKSACLARQIQRPRGDVEKRRPELARDLAGAVVETITMTNFPSAPVEQNAAIPGTDITAHDIIMSTYERQSLLMKRGTLLNREIIFDALQAAGVSHVEIHFDGYSDSGQIEGSVPYAINPAEEIAFPEIKIVLWNYDYNTGELAPKHEPFQDAIETFAFDMLEDHHDGWENDDGAFGDVILKVQTRTVSIDFNERYTQYTSTTHEV